MTQPERNKRITQVGPTYGNPDAHNVPLSAAQLAGLANVRLQDIQYWDDWPVHRPFLILGGIKLQQCDLVQTSSRLPASSDVYEVRRNWPLIRYSGSTRDGIGLILRMVWMS